MGKTVDERLRDYQESSIAEDFESFALRGDGALVIWDNFGQFEIQTDPEGVIFGTVNGQREEVYCEPVWLSGFWDHYYEMLGDNLDSDH